MNNARIIEFLHTYIYIVYVYKSASCNSSALRRPHGSNNDTFVLLSLSGAIAWGHWMLGRNLFSTAQKKKK